ncbi:hypothetical protein TRIUR3_27851 [Triticum urartu]|uniref:Uncharacterized protein n=1 Tax=Triticum urartu TaxID=4572 RepID=M7YXY8_TRIUA|nr:hypothetical protein TRIUR3_27851 [Triticum urartu]
MKHLSSWRKERECHGNDNGFGSSWKYRCKRKSDGSIQKMMFGITARDLTSTEASRVDGSCSRIIVEVVVLGNNVGLGVNNNRGTTQGLGAMQGDGRGTWPWSNGSTNTPGPARRPPWPASMTNRGIGCSTGAREGAAGAVNEAEERRSVRMRGLAGRGRGRRRAVAGPSDLSGGGGCWCSRGSGPDAPVAHAGVLQRWWRHWLVEDEA